MATKQYKSKTHLCINAVLANGKSIHISFSPHSNGTSTYITSNEEIQTALEHHYQYGKMFRGVVIEPPKPKPSKKEKQIETEKKLRTITVSDLGAAKDYLADTFGISRTALRSKKAIEDTALQKGVELKILA